MKIFTENDRWVELSLDEKVRFNGRRLRAEEIYETLVQDGVWGEKQIDERRKRIFELSKWRQVI